ncbi:thiolase family protein, partial [Pseudomonas syringae pv. actinidiae ICMP 18804]
MDGYALLSHQRALESQASGRWSTEIVAVTNEHFELAGYQPRGIELPR